MSETAVPFNRQTLTLRIPDKCEVMPLQRPAPPGHTLGDFDIAAIQHAMLGVRRLLVVVNDGFRPTPTQAMLEKLKPVLRRAEEVRLIVATGKHPAPSAEELTTIVGTAADRYPVTVHDATQPGSTHEALSDGSPLELNGAVDWADRILLLGSVEPHFFAGFTGGAKQILPGLATAATIEANHRNAVHPNCRPCNTAGNPVAAPIREVSARFGDRLWSMQGVAGPKGWEMFCGQEAVVFAESTRRCRETATVRWPGPLDVLVAVVDEPLDRNLYQLQKGFENHQWAVRDGGDLLLISSCRDGVGNDFFAGLMSQYPDWQQLPEWEKQPYSLGLHKLYRTAAAKRRIGLHLYSTLPAELAEKFWFEPVVDLPGWLAERTAAGRQVGVVYDAAGTVSEVVNEASN